MARDHLDKRNWFARHKILSALLILVILGVISGAAGGGKQTASDTPKSTPSQPKIQKPTPAKVGDKVRDGKFEFVVNSIKCGETSVGESQYLTVNAQGQFCRLNLSVSNIGDKAQSLFADDQKLKDSQNREYSYASEATVYAQPSSSATWYNDINPGNSVTGDIIYDVPAAVTPLTAVLHDSAYSNGVSVALQ